MNTATPAPPLTAADVLTVAQAASVLGCSTRHVYGLVERGQMPGARRLGRRVLISRRALERWLHDDLEASPSSTP